MFRAYIDSLWSNVPVENTLVLSSEDLDSHPHLVWSKISNSIGLSSSHPLLAEFDKVRYNTQADFNSKGESKTVSTDEYKVREFLFLIEYIESTCFNTKAWFVCCEQISTDAELHQGDSGQVLERRLHIRLHYQRPQI